MLFVRIKISEKLNYLLHCTLFFKITDYNPNQVSQYIIGIRKNTIKFRFLTIACQVIYITSNSELYLLDKCGLSYVRYITYAYGNISMMNF